MLLLSHLVVSDSLHPHEQSSPPGCSVHGILQARILGYGLPFPPPGDLTDPGIKPMSPVSPELQVDSLPTEPSGKSPFSLAPSKKAPSEWSWLWKASVAATHDGWPTPCKSLALGELVGAHGLALVSRGVALGLLMWAQPSPGFSLWVILLGLRLLCTVSRTAGFEQRPCVVP